MYVSSMDTFSLISSSLLNNSNWGRLFENIIMNEILSLNNLNFNINQDNIDSNEYGIRLQFEYLNFQPLLFNTSTNWVHFLPLEYEGTNFNEINFTFEIGSTLQSQQGLSKSQIEEKSTKILITETTDCYICLDSLLTNSCMRKINACEHKFCIDCIDEWLKNNKSCPICKRILI